MRASELLGADVVDATGRDLGKVCDVRIATQDPTDAEPRRRISVTALVVGNAAWPHRWGLADDRTRGPAVLKWVAGRVARGWIRVPVDQVADWRPGLIRLSVSREQAGTGEVR